MRAEEIAGWMAEPELAVLRTIASSQRPGCVWVEVGSWHGRSAHAVGLALPPDSTLYLVDPYQADETTSSDQASMDEARLQCGLVVSDLQSQRPDLRVERLFMTGAEAAEFVAAADVVFLDGDHREAAVAAELPAWDAKAKMLFGHDIDWPGVRAALLARYGPIFAIAPGTQIWMRINPESRPATDLLQHPLAAC